MNVNFSINQVVKFSYRGKKLSGVIVRIGFDTLNLKVNGDPAEYQILKSQAKTK